MLSISIPLLTEAAMQSLMSKASTHYDSGQFKNSYELYIQALFSAIEELRKLEFIDQCVTENSLSPIFSLASSCLGHASHISLQHKKKIPPPLPTKPISLSSSLPPPLPPRNYLNEKPKKALVKSNSIKVKAVKPVMVSRRSSSPNISINIFQCSYNKELFLMSTNRIQDRICATSLTDSSLDNTPLIPQPPLEYISDVLQHQEQFDLSFEKLRSLQSINILTILQFHPVLIAYQLTLIESAIFRKITPETLENHSAKSPEIAIVTSTDFFNYLTRLIEHSILIKLEASDRAQYLNHWIKVASRCKELKNYQTLKAVISALGTPPLQRLKQSWSFVPKKSMHLLDEMTELMSEASNYEKYRRTVLQYHSKVETAEPMVPFLGTFIHDITYLCALNHQKDAKIADLMMLFTDMQKVPDYTFELSACYLKEVQSYHRPRFSIRSNSARRNYQEDEFVKLSIDLQQCLVTQYLASIPF